VYEFPEMLGPAEDHPVGSFEWANCWAARLQGASRSVDQHTAMALRRIIFAISEVDPPIWEVWPKPPTGTPEDFCQLVCGRSWEGLINDVIYHTKDEKIARHMEYDLRLKNAKAQVANRSQGTRTDLLPVQHTKLKSGTGQRDYTLRRLLRERPDLVERIERGEFSVNAAAIEAGFRKKQTPFEIVIKLLPKLSPGERAKVHAATGGR
jgi:hypothetical protein